MGDAKKVIKGAGLNVEGPGTFTWMFLRGLHQVRGCKSMPHWKIVNDKMVEVGRICPVCWTEYPLE